MLSQMLVTILCYLMLTHVSFGQKIIKGHEATPHSNPYMAAIIKDSNKYDRCGGALVSENFVLTAAQCVSGYLVDVVLGAHDILAYESQKQVYRIPEKNKIVHPSYDENTLLNNIALLKLPETLKFNAYIQKIDMAPEDSELFIGEPAIFTGWGIAGIFYMPSKLQQVELTVMGNNKCKLFRQLNSTEMCASSPIGYVGLGGKGDAGSPFIIYRNNSNLLIGIASHKPSMLTFAPPVFSRISSFKKWIDENLSGGKPLTSKKETATKPITTGKITETTMPITTISQTTTGQTPPLTETTTGIVETTAPEEGI